MPAKSEKQRRLMAACSHGAKYSACPRGMSKAQMRDFSFTSHMPPGASLSPKGDLEKRSDHEYRVQRHFKGTSKTYFPSDTFGSHVGEPGKLGSADYGTKATH